MVNIDKIIAVSGKAGLFRLVASKPNGLILEELAGKKVHFYASRSYQFSPLETIGIYSLGADNIPLKDVYQRFLNAEPNDPVPGTDAEDANCRGFFEKIIPEYDPYRVRIRDIRKCFQWYRELMAHGLIAQDPPAEQAD
ncbi:MAG: DUF5606 domain-containing protein [Saprospiraceae bacterium]|nr:DUF5606 domain-containing protein [Saprospiraceae bacterium]